MSITERLTILRGGPTLTIPVVSAGWRRKLAGRANRSAGEIGDATPGQGCARAVIAWTCWI